ncbi:MAG: PRD domain-containing protein [Solobacterium sp.]|nr:PRD domain-containing protein [Solobacterium sp.]
MKVIKSINNNVAHCSDSKGREVIVFGKGIGFYRPEEEIPLSKINRTFYNIKDTDYGILRAIPTVVINTAIYIIDMVSDELSVNYPSSKAISLADHLQFAIERKDKNIYLEMPILQDIRMLHPEEMDLAERSLKIIKDMTGESLPRQEAGTLALHFIADRLEEKEKTVLDTAAITEECTKIIEKEFSTSIDRGSFNYSRFATHLDYLIRRLTVSEQIESLNEEMVEQVRKNYPQSYACAEKVTSYLRNQTQEDIRDEEVLYLSMHINRMVSRI